MNPSQNRQPNSSSIWGTTLHRSERSETSSLSDTIAGSFFFVSLFFFLIFSLFTFLYPPVHTNAVLRSTHKRAQACTECTTQLCIAQGDQQATSSSIRRHRRFGFFFFFCLCFSFSYFHYSRFFMLVHSKAVLRSMHSMHSVHRVNRATLHRWGQQATSSTIKRHRRFWFFFFLRLCFSISYLQFSIRLCTQKHSCVACTSVHKHAQHAVQCYVLMSLRFKVWFHLVLQLWSWYIFFAESSSFIGTSETAVL